MTIYFINDFSKDTTRGRRYTTCRKNEPIKSTKATVNTKKEEGVGFDYATNWSFGFEEIGKPISPKFLWEASSAGLDENSAVYKTLSSKGVSHPNKQQ